ncbi:protein MraZ [Parcubacteria bacterium SG8_24]|nr:MAG: protein MraZ [Parcubacteria bacterium SG8_24]
MFIGEYQHNVDGKGRMAIPAKFRKSLSGGAVVTRGFDNCLFIFTRQDWKSLAQKLAALSFSKSDNRAFSRLMLAGAMDVKTDRQGRVMLPEYLRRYARIDKEVAIAGLYDRLEVWDRTSWEKYKAKTEKKSNEIAERMGELGV